MAWPDNIESLPTDFAGTDSAATRDHAGLHTTAFRLLNAMQSELGLNVRGAFASVRARLDAVDADARWTDQRTPLDGSVTDAKVAAGIGQSKVSGLVAALAARASKVTVGAQQYDPVIYNPTSPLNVIVPAFAGQRCLVDPSNAANLGAREWVATGTTVSSWVVSDGDTGWLDVVVWDAAGTITKGAFGSADWGPRSGQAGYIKVRRTAEAASLRILQAVSLKAANTSAIVVLPVGFRSDASPCLVAFPLAQSSMSLAVAVTGTTYPFIGAASGEVLGPYSMATVSFPPLASPPWPTAAPV